MNFAQEDVASGILRDRARVGASLADISPMNIDRSVTFDSIGGLKHHIRALKEMIIFPLLYPEVFERFQIAPPRGVLFHGPPGEGRLVVVLYVVSLTRLVMKLPEQTPLCSGSG